MKKKVIIIIILVFILLSIVLIFNKNTSKKVIKNKIVKKETTKKKKEKWIAPSGDKIKLNVYYDSKNALYEVINEYDSYNYNLSSYKLINSYRCNLNDCTSYIPDYNSKKVVIKDDDYYLYDFVNNKALKLNLSNSLYNSITILSFNNKVYGLSISNINDKYAFYSFSKKDFTTDFIYNNIYDMYGACLTDKKVIVSKDDKNYVINYSTGKIVKEFSNSIGCFGNENGLYYYENFGDENNDEVIIYDNSFKKILKDTKYKMYSLSKKGNLIVKNHKEESFSIYNKKGILIKMSKTYKEILDIIEGNIIVIDNDNYLKIVDHDGNIKSKILEINESLKYDHLSLRVVDDKIYFSVININKEEDNIKTYYYDTKTMKKGVLN